VVSTNVGVGVFPMTGMEGAVGDTIIEASCDFVVLQPVSERIMMLAIAHIVISLVIIIASGKVNVSHVI